MKNLLKFLLIWALTGALGAETLAQQGAKPTGESKTKSRSKTAFKAVKPKQTEPVKKIGPARQLPYGPEEQPATKP